ncbi:Nramp family divalent metal transporter [Terribacillus saccharophilus]|uniref:Nramp family divalent metal transporter n=1 Tax=Terribacillus saccharophilus TaxID=361277 RepID=UPI003982485B
MGKERDKGWLSRAGDKSLEESNHSVAIPENGNFFKKLFAFMGPGVLVAVGFIDPGNWETSISAGSSFGYMLLAVVLLSNLIAMLMQGLAAKLGIATGRDLAQATRDAFHPKVVAVLWLLTELAIIATDLAEVLGSAIALNLLFHIPIMAGIIITALDVLLLLLLQKKGFRWMEAIITVLMITIAGCFLFEMIFSHPALSEALKGYIPSPEIVTNPSVLFLALGILGATVMPHNLYLHSSIVQTRNYQDTEKGKKEAVRFAYIDSTFSLGVAFFVNSAILILGAAAFHTIGQHVEGIEDAYKLLSPAIGAGAASFLFGFALLLSGQSSTITGTLTGQIVMEGFIQFRIKPWVRRLVTRIIAIIPALIVVGIYGPSSTGDLLVWSQVILSLQLSFAVIPLVLFTSSKKKMGSFVNKPHIKVLAWTATGLIVSLNAFMLGYMIVTGHAL